MARAVRQKGLGMGIAIGAGMGVAIGAGLGGTWFAVSIAVGTGLGVAVGAFWDERHQSPL